MEGHNPNASMLPATTSSPIVAMQGGGYDPTMSLIPASSGVITPMQGGNQTTLLPVVPLTPIEGMKGGAPSNEDGLFLSSSSFSSSAPTEADIVAAAEAEAARVVSVTRQAEEEAAKRVIIEAAEAEAGRVVTEAIKAAVSASSASSPSAAPSSAPVVAPVPAVPAAPVVAPSLPKLVKLLSYLDQIKDSSVGAVAPFTVTVSASSPLTGTTVKGPGLHDAVKRLEIDFTKITLGKSIEVKKLRVSPL